MSYNVFYLPLRISAMKRFVWFVLGVMLMSLSAPAGADTIIYFYDHETKSTFNWVLFAPGSAQLSENAKRVLDRQIACLNSGGRTKLSICGNADKVEVDNKDAAVRLGKHRAQAVKDYFVFKGFAASDITTMGKGWIDYGHGPAKNRLAITRITRDC
jgi:hypothetical protein